VALGLDYSAVMAAAVANDPNIGRSHVQVPGPDGQLGFGGACLPKDLCAILALADLLKVPVPVLKAAWQSNLARRSVLDWEKMPGRAVEVAP
jgi:UDP-glucose 6-dehydrogenase